MIELPEFPSRTGVKGRPNKQDSETRTFFKTKLSEVINEMHRTGKIWTTRGWCYTLEELAGLRKNDFDAVEGIIVELRKEGLVPLDAVLEDQGREWEGFESIDYEGPDDYADYIVRSIRYNIESYTPHSFWSSMNHFVCVAVEKRDLLSIFRPICREYNVPLANFRGCPDLLSRGKVLSEFMWHWKHNRKVVILYCGDHDPAGLRMSGEEMIDNFAAMNGTILKKEKLQFFRDMFSVERFGLNKDFIDKEDIKWSENLITGQKDKSKVSDLADPRHNDHNKPYVQNYLKEFGSRKVESNVLVVHEEKGQRLCRDAIEKYINLNQVSDYDNSLKQPRLQLAKIVSVKLSEGIDLKLAA